MKKLIVTALLCASLTSYANTREEGFQSRIQEITHSIESKSDLLDKTFSFSHLVSNNHLPPVIKVPVIKVNGRECSSEYPCIIEKPAISACYFTTGGCMPITWKNYLYEGFPKVNSQGITKKNINIEHSPEYLAGEREADQLFQRNLANLEYTYIGMWKYRTLEQQAMVTNKPLIKE